MTALAVIAPDHYIGVVEAVGQVAKTVDELLAKGTAYRLALPAGEGDPGAADIYFDLSDRARLRRRCRPGRASR